MELQMQVPLDHGFLRRECPSCKQQFKWYAGATAEKPADFVDLKAYFCPLCGQQATLDSWWTVEQLELAKSMTLKQVMSGMQHSMSRALRGSKNIVFKPARMTETRPARLIELEDMTIAKSPCHSWEPVKVPEDALTRLYCLICGDVYSTI